MSEELKSKLEHVISILEEEYYVCRHTYRGMKISNYLSLLREHQEDDKCFGEQFIKLKEDYQHALEAVTAQLEELRLIAEALGTNEGHSSVEHIVKLRQENEKLKEDNKRLISANEHWHSRVALLLTENESLSEQLLEKHWE